jgi:hypothetical protein
VSTSSSLQSWNLSGWRWLSPAQSSQILDARHGLEQLCISGWKWSEAVAQALVRLLRAPRSALCFLDARLGTPHRRADEAWRCDGSWMALARALAAHPHLQRLAVSMPPATRVSTFAHCFAHMARLRELEVPLKDHGDQAIYLEQAACAVARSRSLKFVRVVANPSVHAGELLGAALAFRGSPNIRVLLAEPDRGAADADQPVAPVANAALQSLFARDLAISDDNAQPARAGHQTEDILEGDACMMEHERRKKQQWRQSSACPSYDVLC